MCDTRSICVIDTKNIALLFSFWSTDGPTLQFNIVCSVTTKILKYFIACFAVCILYEKNKYIRNQMFVQLLLSKTSRVKAHCIYFHILTMPIFGYSPNRITMSLQRLYSFVTFCSSKDIFFLIWRIWSITNIWKDCTFYKLKTFF